MKPELLLAETWTTDGAHLTLVGHDGSYCIRMNGRQLMHSAASSSETMLGTLGCERHVRKNRRIRVLIGGLGLGFTLKSVLAAVRGNASVRVTELLPEIIAWNRTHLAGLNGRSLDDRRVKTLAGDVRTFIRHGARTPYDVIILDVDNGTTAMARTGSNEPHGAHGLKQVARALKPGGRVAIWSACPDAMLANRLRDAGLAVQAVPARLQPRARRCSGMIYLGDKPAGTGAIPAKAVRLQRRRN